MLSSPEFVRRQSHYSSLELELALRSNDEPDLYRSEEYPLRDVEAAEESSFCSDMSQYFPMNDMGYQNGAFPTGMNADCFPVLLSQGPWPPPEISEDRFRQEQVTDLSSLAPEAAYPTVSEPSFYPIITGNVHTVADFAATALVNQSYPSTQNTDPFALLDPHPASVSTYDQPVYPSSHSHVPQPEEVRGDARVEHNYNPREPEDAEPSFPRAACRWGGHCSVALDDLTPSGITRHLREYHFGRDEWDNRARGPCKWGGNACTSKLGEPLFYASFGKHVASVHLRTTARRCPACHEAFTRADVLDRHRKRYCRALECPPKT